MVSMGSAWNSKGSLTGNFGSSGASVLFYSKWKSSNIADSSLQITWCTSQWLMSNRRLLTPVDPGVPRRCQYGITRSDKSRRMLVNLRGSCNSRMTLTFSITCSARSSTQQQLTSMTPPWPCGISGSPRLTVIVNSVVSHASDQFRLGSSLLHERPKLS